MEKLEAELLTVLNCQSSRHKFKSIENLSALMLHFIYMHYIPETERYEKKEFLRIDVKASGLRVTFTDGSMISTKKLYRKIMKQDYMLVARTFSRKKLCLKTEM